MDLVLLSEVTTPMPGVCLGVCLSDCFFVCLFLRLTLHVFLCVFVCVFVISSPVVLLIECWSSVQGASNGSSAITSTGLMTPPRAGSHENLTGFSLSVPVFALLTFLAGRERGDRAATLRVHYFKLPWSCHRGIC